MGFARLTLSPQMIITTLIITIYYYYILLYYSRDLAALIRCPTGIWILGQSLVCIDFVYSIGPLEWSNREQQEQQQPTKIQPLPDVHPTLGRWIPSFRPHRLPNRRPAAWAMAPCHGESLPRGGGTERRRGGGHGSKDDVISRSWRDLKHLMFNGRVDS